MPVPTYDQGLELLNAVAQFTSIGGMSFEIVSASLPRLKAAIKPFTSGPVIGWLPEMKAGAKTARAFTAEMRRAFGAGQSQPAGDWQGSEIHNRIVAAFNQIAKAVFARKCYDEAQEQALADIQDAIEAGSLKRGKYKKGVR